LSVSPPQNPPRGGRGQRRAQPPRAAARRARLRVREQPHPGTYVGATCKLVECRCAAIESNQGAPPRQQTPGGDSDRPAAPTHQAIASPSPYGLQGPVQISGLGDVSSR
jgi:hypothetical protein